jgi:hypothetical protein
MWDQKETRQLIIIRGAQGAGKSSTAAVWANWKGSRWYEADQYWEDRNGNYDYDPGRIAFAHAWCFDMVEAALRKGVSRVIVSNTFRKAADVDRYFKLGRKWHYDVNVYVVAGKHENTHGVPEDVVAKCRAGMEPWFGEHLYVTTSQGIRELVELYPKYKDVCIMLPDKDEGYDGFPWVAPRPGEEGFSKHALGESYDEDESEKEEE